MRVREILILSFKNAVSGRITTVLCVLAVVMGIFSFYIAQRGGELAKAVIETEMNNIGVRGMALYSNNRDEISEKEMSEISRMQGIKDFAPLNVDNCRIRLAQKSSSAVLLGTSGNIKNIWSLGVIHGDTFSGAHVARKSKVAVVDSVFAEKAYKRQNIVGKTINIAINGVYEEFEIIGVVSSQKQSLQSLIGTNVPEIVYVPYTVLGNAEMAVFSCLPEADADEIGEAVIKKLNANSGYSFSYKNLDSYVISLKRIANAVCVFASAFALVALTVGGIGVMGNMINAAEDRKYEIGVIMSLGAHRRDIVLIHLLESVYICMTGGIIGWMIGECSVDYIGYKMGIYVGNGSGTALFGILMSVICGITFGIVPAFSAASLKPINALRK